jgi:hypothetical protein
MYTLLNQRTGMQTGRGAQDPCYLSLRLQSRAMPKGKATYLPLPNETGTYVCLQKGGCLSLFF